MYNNEENEEIRVDEKEKNEIKSANINDILEVIFENENSISKIII